MNDQSTPEGEPKIVVDDDWKSQVEKEKEELQQKMDAGETESDYELPEANFPILITSLATQAMVALGVIPDPISNQPQPNPAVAKHVIDLIAMLDEKTKGNLSKEEEAFLQDTLHQLRMTFVTLREELANQPEPDSKPTIELP